MLQGLLLEGDLDFAYSSRSIEQQEYILARQQGFTLREYHIAIDAIAIAVHPYLQIPGLTIEQLKRATLLIPDQLANNLVLSL